MSILVQGDPVAEVWVNFKQEFNALFFPLSDQKKGQSPQVDSKSKYNSMKKVLWGLDKGMGMKQN